MANWTVASDSKAFVDEATVAANEKFNLKISNIINGVYSGYNLSATDFKIGNASQSGTTWTGGNVDSGIAKVIFSDDGTAGDPANIVNAEVYTLEFTADVDAAIKYIDIDEVTGLSPDTVRPTFIFGEWEYTAAGHTVTPLSLEDGTVAGESLQRSANASSSKTEVDDGTTSGTQRYSFSGSVPQGTSTIVSYVTFTAASGYFYRFEPTISFSNLKSYANSYSSEVVSTRTSGYITSFVVKVYYTPSTSFSGSSEDVEQLGHTFGVNYSLAAVSVPVSNTIKKLSYTKFFGKNGQSAVVRVAGSPNTDFTLKIVYKDLTKQYNFATKLFQTTTNQSSVYLGTTNGFGFSYVSYDLPDISGSNVEYKIVIESRNGSVILPATQAKSNDVVQYGNSTLTLQPISLQGESFGSLPSGVEITRATSYTSSAGHRPEHVEVRAVATTGGSALVNLTLTKAESRIHSGMIAMGAGIPHGTTVVQVVKNNVIKLSQTATVAANTQVKFVRDSSDIFEFSFAIGENNSGDDISIIKQPYLISTPIGGLGNVSVLTNGQDFRTIVTVDSVAGLAIGMSVSSTNIVKDADGNDPVITSIDFANGGRFTLNVAQPALGNNELLLFSNSLTTTSSLLFAQATVLGSPNTRATISGYIKVGEIFKSGDLNLFLDDIIAVA
jgi:hypothetical protein